MFGGIAHTEDMLTKMSTPELVQLAKNPTVGNPTVQYAALSEIENRKKMRTPPQAPVNQPTVLQKMAMEAMAPPAPTPVPGDPVGQGIAALAQQQQAPQRMAGGGVTGRIASNAVGLMDQLSPYFDTEAMTPDEARAQVADFYGTGQYLDDLLPGIKEDEERARNDRRMAMWLALARAGFGMSSTGNIGQGATMGLDAAGEAMSDYNEALSGARSRRDRVSLARGERQDRMSGLGLEALMNDRREASSNREQLLASSLGIAETGAQIEASNARDQSQLQEIANMLYAENEGEMVQDGTVTRTTPGGQTHEIPFSRPYSREDAYRDALMMVGGGRGGLGGRTADDLNERLASARQILDPANRRYYTEEQRQAAADTLSGIMSGEVGNYNTTTGNGRQSAQGNRAPVEGRIRPSPSQIEEYRNSRGARTIGERDGERVISPYTSH